MTISAVLLSGGQGTRFGAPKHIASLAGKPLALHSYAHLLHSPLISELIVVCHESYRPLFPEAKWAPPGERRQDSLASGFTHATGEYILVHDAARPLFDPAHLEALIEAGKNYGAATLATPVKPTIKQADHNHMVMRTLDRSSLFEIQTPQILRRDLLVKGFAEAARTGATVTDDVSLAELIGHPVKLVMGSYRNLKVTTPEDLIIAEALVQV